MTWLPKFWKMGTKLGGLKVLSAFGWLSGAPLCSVSGPKEPKDHKEGVRVKWLSHSPRMACGHEKPVEGAQKWAIWDVLPAVVEKHVLGQAALCGTVEVVSKLTQLPPPGRWVTVSLLLVFGQQAHSS